MGKRYGQVMGNIRPQGHLRVAQQGKLILMPPIDIFPLGDGNEMGFCPRQGRPDIVNFILKNRLIEPSVEQVGDTVSWISRRAPSVSGVPDEGHPPASRILHPMFGNAVIIEGRRPAPDRKENAVFIWMVKAIYIRIAQGSGAGSHGGCSTVSGMINNILTRLYGGDNQSRGFVSVGLVKLGDRIKLGQQKLLINHILGNPLVRVWVKPQNFGKKQRLIKIAQVRILLIRQYLIHKNLGLSLGADRGPSHKYLWIQINAIGNLTIDLVLIFIPVPVQGGIVKISL